MRRTVTFDNATLDTAAAMAERGEIRAAAAELANGEVPASESGRIALLTAIGAELVTRRAMERGYRDLASLLHEDPAPKRTQRSKGRPLTGESDAGVDALLDALET